MFSKLWSFVKRHKKKFIFTGVVVFGGRYLYGYALRRLKDFQEREAAECLVNARRQHHFDSNQRTCNMTVLSMLPTIRHRLIELFNTEELTEQLKTSPPNKLQLWDDLKVLSISRVISVVYGCTLMCLMLRVQLNIIGGYMYVDNVNQHEGLTANAAIPITPSEVQERYLALIKKFFDKGLEDLTSEVKAAAQRETNSVGLKERLSVQNIEALIKHIRERVENGRTVDQHSYSTLPLSHHLICWSDGEFQGEGDGMYFKLLQETQDILESHDFHLVLATCLDRGFAKLMDYVADFYKNLQRNDPSAQHFHEVSVPVAKLIPFLSGLINKLGSDAPNPLVQELLLQDQTKTLAANIYEAFSQTGEELEDAQFAP